MHQTKKTGYLVHPRRFPGQKGEIQQTESWAASQNEFLDLGFISQPKSSSFCLKYGYPVTTHKKEDGIEKPVSADNTDIVPRAQKKKTNALQAGPPR